MSVGRAEPIPPGVREGAATLQAKWQAQHAGFVARAKAGDIDILLLGDSITHRWPEDLWDKAFPPLKAGRFGIEGEQVQNLSWRLQNGELEGLKPKAVVFLIGTNNVPREYRAADIADTVGAMVEFVQAKSPSTRVLVLGVLPRNEKPTNIMRDRIILLNEKLAKLDNGDSVRFLDLTDDVTAADGSITREAMPDFLHPSRSTYEVMMKKISPKISELSK
jgi:lysophospholipase L1-like esterase